MKYKGKNQVKKLHLSTTQIIVAGFMGTILLGAFLLMLPVSSAANTVTPFIDSLFTSATSVCVTGLSTLTTAEHWSVFGKIIILMLIQVGGLGVITVYTVLLILIGKRVTMRERAMIQESYSLDTLSGLVKLIIRIMKGTLVVEGIGTIFYAIQFVPDFGLIPGILSAVFTSISAFCNAGIDIIGSNSLGDYVHNPIVNLTTMSLIVTGGIGFIVWWDILKVWKEGHGQKRSLRRMFAKLTLHSKVALSMTVFMIVSGTIIYFLLEYQNPKTMESYTLGEKLLASAFQSVTTRTAGFQTIPQENFTNGSTLITIILMFIGGSPAGTAGGIKTTTFAILLLTVISVAKGNNDIEAFGRRISVDNLKTALAVISIGLGVVIGSTLLLSITESTSLVDTTFEVVSAIGTVGLTRGITTSLSWVGKLIIIVTMYLGRIGPVTMAFAFMMKRTNKENMRKLPEKRLLIG